MVGEVGFFQSDTFKIELTLVGFSKLTILLLTDNIINNLLTFRKPWNLEIKTFKKIARHNFQNFVLADIFGYHLEKKIKIYIARFDPFFFKIFLFLRLISAETSQSETLLEHVKRIPPVRDHQGRGASPPNNSRRRRG